MSAKYDAAQTTDENRKHWSAADALSANAANRLDVRYKLRNRSRYEYANNPYAHGIVNTIANYIVGTGPRLQLLTPDPVVNRRIELLFSRHAEAIGLPAKLRTQCIARAVSGESFAKIISNPKIGPVQADLSLFECDRVTSLVANPLNGVDGITYDEAGNPVSYNVLRQHPGSFASGPQLVGDSDTVSADLIIHHFRAERPEQCRGIPDLTPALPLFAMLRRYTLAVLNAAEQAASIGGVIYTDTVLDGSDGAVAGDSFPIERGMWTTLPDGYKIGQIKAEQPTTMYGDFKREILNEIARALDIPFNLAAGNSSSYNYASGRLDNQGFAKRLDIEHRDIEQVTLSRFVAQWFREARLISGYLPAGTPDYYDIQYQWLWDGLDHVDPVKEATAAQIRITSGVSNLAIECGRAGQDWEPVAQQRARELELFSELGIPIADAPSSVIINDPADGGTSGGK